MPEVLELNDIGQIEPYRQPWHRLLLETPGASFYQTPEWLEVYWKHYGQHQKLRLLLVMDQGVLCGVVPLTVAREHTRLGRLKVLTYPLHDWGTFYGPIGRDTTATMTLAMQHVAHTHRDWELLDLRWVRKDGAGGSRTASALDAAGFHAQETIWKEAANVDMSIGWEAYWASLDSKMRNNLRRHQRRLTDQGTLELVRHRPRGESLGDADPRFDLFDECVEVAAISWQGTSPTGTTLSHAHVRDYFRDVHAAAAKTGCLDMNVLKLNGKAVGFGYNHVFQGLIEGIRIGYDPQYTKAGAGNVLYLMMFQDSFERGDRLFDMGIGSLDVKRFWWTHTAKSYRYTYYPPFAPRAQLLRLKHWLFGSNVRTEVPIAETHLAS